MKKKKNIFSIPTTIAGLVYLLSEQLIKSIIGFIFYKIIKKVWDWWYDEK